MDINEKELAKVLEGAKKIEEGLKNLSKTLDELPATLFEAMKPSIRQTMIDAYKKGYEDGVRDSFRAMRGNKNAH